VISVNVSHISAATQQQQSPVFHVFTTPPILSYIISSVLALWPFCPSVFPVIIFHIPPF